MIKFSLLSTLLAAVAGMNVASAIPQHSPRTKRSNFLGTGRAANWPSGKVHRKPRGDSGQHPKFKKARQRKQHVHPLRDSQGGFTLVGRGAPEPTGARPRRMWVAGISAQRGY